ncbi:MAG: Transglutaminase domain protein [Candidatus Magasanikbacteria bacterium GW2011_GWC2_45_8]|uniref:Transglutaminase domain protein n=1 Tax=Candidatus Magasanikbacteria bacterium GW2011_GWC2_45_8 TaxID=1619050 RepID=A0A0G1MZ16_9BACT|nr:MAG: Transglutaminase domain protein [Candidatus Magasanikbacteria bacterium GW2011_GWC2_45_8]
MMHKMFLRARIIVPFVLSFLFIVDPPLSALAAEINVPTPPVSASEQPRAEVRVQKTDVVRQETPAPVPAQTPTESTSTEPSTPQAASAPSAAQELRVPSYMRMMRDLRAQKEDKETTPENKQRIAGDLKRFIQSEKDRLSKFDIPNARVRNYLASLESTHDSLDPTPKTLREKLGSLWDTAKGAVLGLFESSDDTKHSPLAVPIGEPRIPKQPAGFRTNDEKIEVKSFIPSGISVPVGQKVSRALQNIATITPAYADVTVPVLAEVQGNNEAPVNEEIKKIARDLHNNPVAIMNFVHNLVRYEPYYGAKKGAVGCLRETVCNDVDASSLTVSLMRAAGIPARYQKMFALFPVEQLQNLLSVDNTKAVYVELYLNKVPVHTIESANAGKSFEEADFSLEKQLAVEWTVPEIFYDYDERGGNIDNVMHLDSATTDQELQTAIAPYPKKQWLPVETLVKPMTHTKKEILADTAGFNSKTFWDGFLQYQGDFTVVEKYRSDLLSATGKNIDDYQSSVTFTKNTLSRLPVTLPYVRAIGAVNGVEVSPEKFAAVPDTRRLQVKISLRKSADNASVFEKTFFASEVNNKDIQLGYTGATEADNQVIDSYGGIAGTPSALVSLIPYADVPDDYAHYNGSAPVKIGDALVLQFMYTLNGATIYNDEKFSVAGNKEGIVMVFSRVQADPSQDSDSNILLHGETGLAREYLKRSEVESALIAGSLDYSSHIVVSRAVVTENRVLSIQNGVPTTFDFKGLSIDASVFINDYSNRGDYTNHRKDFRLLWGEALSHLEGRLFEDITGLESISTVKGLQYAYGKPADYTIHNITSANENEIDTLQFSTNTKTVMHADVQKGNMIVTPQKPVNKGNWTGVIYVSLDPEWTGTYAIGEQAMQNGGETTMYVASKEVPEVKIAFWNVDVVKEEIVNGIKKWIGYKFVFKDKPKDDLNLACSMLKKRYDVIQTQADWQEKFGPPCAERTEKGYAEAKKEGADEEEAQKQAPIYFGDVQHSFILTTEAIKYYNPSINNEYIGGWVMQSDVLKKVDDYIKQKKSLPQCDRNLSTCDSTWLADGEKLNASFSSIVGTYKQSACETDGWKNCGDHATIYYVPVPTAQNGSVFRAHSDILSKLNGDNDDLSVIKKLGFPLNDETQAADSDNIKDGFWQNFVNGHVYKYKSWGLTWTYYTYGEITKLHSANNGTGGELGFPDSDPKQGAYNNGKVFQKFENEKEIEWDTTLKSDAAKIVAYKKYRCEVYGGEKNLLKLSAIALEGILDTGANTITGVASMLWGAVKSIVNSIFHPVQTYEDVKDILNEVSKLNWEKVKDFLVATGDKVYAETADEINTSFKFGNGGCEARAEYLIGRMIGEVALIIFPASKLKFVSELRVMNKVEDLKVLKIMGEISEETAETLAGLARAGKYKGKPIFGFLTKYSEEAKWYKKPLDYDGFDLGLLAKDGYLKGDLDYGFYSIKKALSDKELFDLSQKGEEIIFVLKQDGTMIVAPRPVGYKLPHPILSNSEAVRSAGVMRFVNKGIVEIENASGHMYPTFESLGDVKSVIKGIDSSITVKIVEHIPK